MVERNRSRARKKDVAIVLIRGVLEQPAPLEELPGGRVVCRTAITIDGTPLEVLAFDRPAHSLNHTLPGTPVVLTAALTIERSDRPDGRSSQVLGVEVKRVRARGPSTNHRGRF